MLTVNKNKKKSDDFWATMPLDDLAFGNAMDCDFTLRAYHLLKREMEEKHVHHVYNNLLKDIQVILGMVENLGIQVDFDYLEVLDQELQKELKALGEKLQSLVPKGHGEVNPNSTIEMASVLFTSDGFDLRPTSFSEKTQMPQISEEHLTSVKEDTDNQDAINFIETLLKYKYRAKQHKTYVKGVQAALEYNEDGRIYSQYNFATVVTGRLSCSTYSAGKKKKGVSFHTLPRESDSDTINIRKLMRADGDRAFLAADFSQAELRVLAQCCKDANLIEAFNTGQDLHRYTASLVFGKEPEKVTKEERQIAKSVSFLIVYGGGPNKLAQQIGKSISYCKGIFAAYEQSFPKVFKWINQVHKMIRQNGYAVSLFGRRRHLPNIKSPLKKYQYRALRQGMNFVIQSSASDLMLHSIKRLHRYRDLTGLDFDILATVHDSVEVQCDPKDIEKVATLLKVVLTMTDDLLPAYGIDFVVPFEVDVEVGTSFGHLTEAQFSEKGKLLNAQEIQSFIEDAQNCNFN
jgi:DNA polymerase-1